ncbi:MAG: twin-arginine translocation signal domain-containing protein [bacterium]|nr:twin-arginine translocation signal domain-containing protein [bacterium]
MYTRRDFLALGLAAGGALALGGCSSSSPSDPGGGSSGGGGSAGIRGFNVHPYQGSLYHVQMQALQDIGANWTRTTLGIPNDVAGAYATPPGMNVLGLIGDFQHTNINKNDWPDMVETVIRRYPTIQYFQILNEPEIFYNMSNTEYVRDYLRPAHDLIRQKFPQVKIVSAAPIGQYSGVVDFAQMSLAGADQYCDFRGVHIYFEEDIIYSWAEFRLATNKPIMVTETGKRTPEKHLDWWQVSIPEMKRKLDTNYIFYYALLEQPKYTGYEIIRAELNNGTVVPAPGSGLYNYLKTSVVGKTR